MKKTVCDACTKDSAKCVSLMFYHTRDGTFDKEEYDICPLCYRYLKQILSEGLWNLYLAKDAK